MPTAEAAKTYATQDMKEAANQAGRKVRNIYDTVTSQAMDAKDTVTTEIRTNPVRSSVIALGVGFVLGALFRR